jgi:hypothetical protein
MRFYINTGIGSTQRLEIAAWIRDFVGTGRRAQIASFST